MNNKNQDKPKVRRAPRPCKARGCRALVMPGSGAYCAEHKRQATKDDRRPSPHARGYGKAWQRIRTRYLIDNPMCVDPFGVHRRGQEIAFATDVDHIIPKRQGGSDALSNLQALCHSCHSRKTAVQSSGWGRGDRG